MIIIEYQIAIKKIWERAVKEFDVKPNRERHNVIYRHAFSVACLDNTNLSMKVIGRLIDRDHATVIHARKNHNWNLLQEPTYAQAYTYFSELLSNKTAQHEDILQSLLKEQSIKSTDKDMVARYTDIYENKLKRLETKYVSELETLRHSNKTLSRTLKETTKRMNQLNTECLRLKNLL